MRSFFTTLLSLVAVVTSQCSENPDRDFEFYSMLDTTSKTGCIIAYRGVYANAIEKVVNWFEDGGFATKGSATRLNDQDMGRCFMQDARQTSAETALNTIKNNRYLNVRDLNLATHLAGIAWVRQAMWTDEYITDSVRRVIIVVTQGYPDPNVHIVPPNAGNLKFSQAALSGTLETDCALQYFPPAHQVGEALHGSRAGLLFISHPQYASQKDRATMWKTYFDDLNVTDLLVTERPASITWLGQTTEPALFQMVCPSWIATTSTTTVAPPVLYEWAEVSSCLGDSVPCNPCKTDDAAWKESFNACVQSFEA